MKKSLLIFVLASSAMIWLSCAPLWQSGGSINAPQFGGNSRTNSLTLPMSQTILGHGGQAFQSGDSAAINAESTSKEIGAPSRWRYAALILVAVVVLGGVAFFMFTKYKIGLVG